MLANIFFKSLKNVKLQDKSPEATQNGSKNPEKQAATNYQ